MQNLDKDHIAAEAQFHMGCHNQYKADAVKARERAEASHYEGTRQTMLSLAKAWEEVAQEHLELYNQKMSILESCAPFIAQLVVNACGALLQKH